MCSNDMKLVICCILVIYFFLVFSNHVLIKNEQLLAVSYARLSYWDFIVYKSFYSFLGSFLINI